MGSKALMVCVLLVARPATAALWEDATAATIGATGEWSNKVELVDVDGDGRVDIVFANGGDYSGPGAPESNRVFRNMGPGQPFEEITDRVFLGVADLARVVKVRDLNGDGVPDVLVGAAYQTRCRLLLGLGGGDFVEVTQTHLPIRFMSVGDLEIGDVDGDGDLDVVLSDWGPGNPLQNAGAVTRLWLNTGTGAFVDATDARMPELRVRFSWELELADVDNDSDLDVLVASKSDSTSRLFVNLGDGTFVDGTKGLPHFGNNYDFEAMDLDGDGWLDLVTINDGPGLTQHVFRNDGTGRFVDATATQWPAADNPGSDDNMAVFLDADSDGHADLLIGSLDGADRLLLNDGTGRLVLQPAAFSGPATPGTLGIAVADLDGDGRLDVVQAQGEVASTDHVFRGVDLPPDTAPPTVGPVWVRPGDAGVTVRARAHDRKTPVLPHDLPEVAALWRLDDGEETATPMRWAGGLLFEAALGSLGYGALHVRVCATDAAGNTGCSEDQTTDRVDPDPPPEPSPEPVADGAGAASDDAVEPDREVESGDDVALGAEPSPEPGPAPDAGPGAGAAASPGGSGGGCAAGGQGGTGGAGLLWALAALWGFRRRQTFMWPQPFARRL